MLLPGSFSAPFAAEASAESSSASTSFKVIADEATSVPLPRRMPKRSSLGFKPIASQPPKVSLPSFNTNEAESKSLLSM